MFSTKRSLAVLAGMWMLAGSAMTAHAQGVALQQELQMQSRDLPENPGWRDPMISTIPMNRAEREKIEARRQAMARHGATNAVKVTDQIAVHEVRTASGALCIVTIDKGAARSTECDFQRITDKLYFNHMAKDAM